MDSTNEYIGGIHALAGVLRGERLQLHGRGAADRPAGAGGMHLLQGSGQVGYGLAIFRRVLGLTRQVNHTVLGAEAPGVPVPRGLHKAVARYQEQYPLVLALLPFLGGNNVVADGLAGECLGGADDQYLFVVADPALNFLFL